MKRLICLLLFIAQPGFAQWAEKNPAAGGAHSLPTQLFPSDNWWNLNISAAPVDANSATLLAPHAGSDIQADWGGGLPDAPYGIPFIVVSGDFPKVDFAGFSYDSEADDVPYPIPSDSLTEDGWSEAILKNITEAVAEDRHMLIYDKDNDQLYEIYQVFFNNTGSPVTFGGDIAESVPAMSYWSGTAATWDAATNNVRPDDWTSADAAGLQILPGLVQYDEVVGAVPITHAHRMTFSATLLGQHYWPATHDAGGGGTVPMGARLRLKASYDITRGGQNSAQVQRLLQSFKDYGLIVADNGPTGMVQGTNDSRWGDYDLPDLLAQFVGAFGGNNLEIDDFEVIELGWSPAFSITTGSLPNATQGVFYSQQVRGTGGYNNYAWSVSVGSLPAGLTLTSTGTWGLISGTPTGTGLSNFTIAGQDAHPSPETDSQALSITVDAATGSDLRPLIVRPGNNYALLTFGMPNLDYGTDCTLLIKTSPAGTLVETVSSTEGLATRTVTTTVALTASSTYTAEQSCVGAGADVNVYPLTTKATPAGGNRTVHIQAGDPPTFPTAECARVTYDENAALSTPATADNDTCGTGPCTVDLTLPAGLFYYRLDWRTAGCAALLAQGAVQPLQVQ